MEQALKQWLTGSKWEKDRIQKFEYPENEKIFLNEIKKNFIVFEGVCFGTKQKNDKKIVDKSFNYWKTVSRGINLGF